MLDQMAFPPRAPPVIASEEQRPSEGTIRAPLDTSSDGSKRQVGRTTPLRRHNQGAVGHKQRRQQATGRKNNAPPKAQSDLRQATVALLEMVGRTTPLRRHNQRHNQHDRAAVTAGSEEQRPSEGTISARSKIPATSAIWLSR